MMDLNIEGHLFVVTGASSGLGRAVAVTLLENGAEVIAHGRQEEKLESLLRNYSAAGIVTGDVMDAKTTEAIHAAVGERKLAGVFVNAGGPPALSFKETSLDDWDNAYRLLLRWKVDLVRKLLPCFEANGYGRILFSESSTIKQPIENLVLSNSLRMAVAGMAKTLSQELAGSGICVNVIGPGYHETAAVERLFEKKSRLEGISGEEARKQTVAGIPAGMMGNPADFASLAAWMLSPLSGFVTGQVYTLDGGATRFSLG